MVFSEDELIPISAIQHWVFCPRQCGLIHLEGLWAENRLTAEGKILHEKAHQDQKESRGGLRVERGLALRSLVLGIVGKADVVEFHRQADAWHPFPVEYKRGRPKAHDADRLQLAAQAACLEEMLGVAVQRGALFYGAQRRREEVTFDSGLRRALAQAVDQIRAMLVSGRTPPPSPEPHCRSCSLRGQCLPAKTAAPRGVQQYLARQVAAALEKP